MLTIVMLFCSVAGNVFALDLADAAMSEQTNTSTQEPISQDASLSGSSAEETAEPQIIEEDVSKRGKFEKHYLCSDGSYMAVVYPEQVNYYDGGEWKEVDSTLTLSMSGDRYASSNADVSAQFAKNSASEELVSLTDGEYSISWRVDFSGSSNKLTAFDAPVSSVASVKNPTASTRAISEENITSLDKFSSQLSYRNVYNNKVDLRYSVYYGRVEEDIILNSADALTSYRLTVNTGGLTAVKNADNSISFNDGEGNTIFTIAAPWMKDAASEVSDNIEVALVQKGDTAYIIYAPDAEWLTAKERVFPVLIDPSFKTRTYGYNYTDTYVYSGDVASTARDTETTMKIGNKNGINYISYLKIHNIPSLPVASTFYDKAYLIIYTTDNTAMNLTLSAPKTEWHPRTLSYSNQPTSSSTNATVGVATTTTHRVYKFNLTSYINGEDLVYGAGYWRTHNNGFKIQSTSGSGVYSEIYSSNNNTRVEYRPVLQFKYSINTHSAIIDNGVYSFKNVNSGKYLTAGLNGSHSANIYQSTQNNLRTQAFRLSVNDDGDAFRIGSMSSNDGNGNILSFRYEYTIDDSVGYVPITVRLGSATADYEDRYEWIVYFITSNVVKIVSRADPFIALTAYGTGDGTNAGDTPTSPGNVYASMYTGSASQHWYIESGGQTLSREDSNISTMDFFNVDEYSDGLHLCCIVENFGDGMIWTSSNTSIATVSSYGVVTFQKSGRTSINVSVLSEFLMPVASYSTTVHITGTRDGIYRFYTQGTYPAYLYADASNAVRGNTVLYDHTNQNIGYQVWGVEYVGEDSYKITSLGIKNAVKHTDSMALTASGTGSISLHDYIGDDAQKWQFVMDGSKYYVRNLAYPDRSLSITPSSATIATTQTLLNVVEANLPAAIWDGEYVGQSGGEIHIKLVIESNVYDSGVVTEDMFNVVKYWEQTSPYIHIYLPNETAPDYAFVVTVKDEELEGGAVGQLNGYVTSNVNDFHGNWTYAELLLAVTSEFDPRNDNGELNLSKNIMLTIAHELGHALKMAHPKQELKNSNVSGNERDKFVLSLMNQGWIGYHSYTLSEPTMYDKYCINQKWGM